MLNGASRSGCPAPSSDLSGALGKAPLLLIGPVETGSIIIPSQRPKLAAKKRITSLRAPQSPTILLPLEKWPLDASGSLGDAALDGKKLKESQEAVADLQQRLEAASGCVVDTHSCIEGCKVREASLTEAGVSAMRDLQGYLIVVDDVWTVATWDAIRSKLPDYNNGSRIIVTTRIETVAEACSDASVDGDCIYRIKHLNTEDSEKLFLSRAFGREDATLSDDLKVEMDKNLKRCGGLPMAIISIASLLASYKSSESKDMWERVRKSIGSHMESHPTLEGMRQIVTLSFNHLHYYLKGCMMYLSILPEDYVIPKDRLLKRWIAEGLVVEIRGLTLMEVAEAYYNELVSRSMIDRAGDIVTWYDGRVETCRVHDMMLEVMVSKSLESNFVSIVGGPYKGMSYDRIRRLSIHGGEEATEDSPSNKTEAGHSRKNDIEGVKMEQVRSLSMFDPEDHMKVLDRLGKFTLLRVLDLEYCTGIKIEHLRYICRMYLLRFLNLKGTAISEMPEEVGELENLEMLDARETHLKDLPKTVSKLQKLEHLQISNHGNNNGWIARRGQGRMKALRTVNKLVLKCDVNAAQEIGDLQQLRELGIVVDMTDMSSPLVQEVNQKLAESLSKMFSLRWLNIRSTSYDKNAMNFLHDVKSPPRLLQYLRIGAGISKLPDWIGSLNNVVDLFIAWTFVTGDQLFEPVCKLRNLERMHLEVYCYGDRELVARTAHTFPALKELSVDFNGDNMEAVQFQEKSMVKLERLILQFWEREDKTVVGIEHLTNLKEVKLTGTRHNPAFDRGVEQVKAVNMSRPKSDQIKVVVKYE
ncbi:disease resistance protein Pik-2-like [Triticum dicoccoides]|uniref:disease resistance protein Pik-2-like n=1 Tax=Triticum dicoccoides TaxID=85692 RepID=UPI00188F4FD2|nr:disease resistance protein Pik-2-like [Triticum dicoccoides]